MASEYNSAMTQDAAKLLKGALQLPDRDRAELAASLIESLDEQMDEDVETAWQVEIERRVKELDDGTVQPIPWPEVRKRLRGRTGDAPVS
jgi:putative addiction module component (TIGR02574 family)